jgi:hypothetical protein
MKGMVVKIIVTGALVFGVAAQAHHSFAAMYVAESTVEIEGQVIQFAFRNPHSFMHVMVADKDGELTRWNVEWGAASALTNTGLQADSLRRGDVVVIMGNPGRNADDHRLRLRTLRRPADGFGWGTGAGETFD